MLGELLTGCVFAALWFFQVTHSWIWWLVALGVGTLVLVSSRFATQVLLGFCTIIGTLELAWPILLLPWLAGMSATLVFGQRYLDLFKAHLTHLRWFSTKTLSQQHPLSGFRERFQ